MKTRKIRAAVIAILSGALILSSCSKKTDQGTGAPAKAAEKNQDETGKVRICATFYPLYIMLMNITDGIGNVELSLLAPADTGCLHDYQLTTKDMKKISSCDILVANGGGMETFLEKAIAVKKDRTVIASENFQLTDGNPHIWVSPTGAVSQVCTIAQALAEMDSANKKAYLENAKSYTERLLDLIDEMHGDLDGFRGRKIITFHEAFPYFADEFNLELASMIERESGTVPSKKELAAMIKEIKEASGSSRPVLFAEPDFNSTAASVIANETGLEVFELDPCVTGKLEKDSYMESMRKNSSVLKKAFEK